MKVSEFIKWLEKQTQDLEVYVVESYSGYDNGGDYYEKTEFVCFDDPAVQSSKTGISLRLGVE